MFTALHGLARRSTLHLLIVAEGAQLRVTVQPKPSGSDAPIPPALSLLATPEEFDRDFATVVAQYETPTTSLLDQGKAAADAVTQAAEKKPAAKPKKASPAKSTKPTKTKAAKPAPQPKPAAKKPAAPPPAAAVKPATATEKKPAAPPKPAPTNDSSASASERETLIKLAQTYLANLAPGSKPTRAGFIAAHKEGRRYERLFGTFDDLLLAVRPFPNATAQASDADREVRGPAGTAPAAGGIVTNDATPLPRANETILSPDQLQSLGITAETEAEQRTAALADAVEAATSTAPAAPAAEPPAATPTTTEPAPTKGFQPAPAGDANVNAIDTDTATLSLL